MSPRSSGGKRQQPNSRLKGASMRSCRAGGLGGVGRGALPDASGGDTSKAGMAAAAACDSAAKADSARAEETSKTLKITQRDDRETDRGGQPGHRADLPVRAGGHGVCLDRHRRVPGQRGRSRLTGPTRRARSSTRPPRRFSPRVARTPRSMPPEPRDGPRVPIESPSMPMATRLTPRRSRCESRSSGVLDSQDRRR